MMMATVSTAVLSSHDKSFLFSPISPPLSSSPRLPFFCACKQVEQSCKVLGTTEGITIPRREALQSLLLLTLTTHYVNGAKAEDSVSNPCDTLAISLTKKLFFDIAIDRKPAGRIVVGLYGETVPIGAKRFAEITIGQKGLSYRKKEFNKVNPTYIVNAGLRSFSLSGGREDVAKFTGGSTAKALISELEDLNQKCLGRINNTKGAVSIVVKDLTKPPAKTKLIAKAGKFELIEEESRPDPNGTEFAIAVKDSPELDPSNLVVGRIVEGMDVVELLSSVRVVKDNRSSPYFQAAKLVGDTRAVVAERGFNRPYAKIVITNCGELKEQNDL